MWSGSIGSQLTLDRAELERGKKAFAAEQVATLQRRVVAGEKTTGSGREFGISCEAFSGSGYAGLGRPSHGVTRI
jgi:hypothetical protein